MKPLYLSALVFLYMNAQALYLPLSVKETAGFDRVQTPLQGGIPLPKGKYTRADLSRFAIVDSLSHNAVPAGFSVNATWIDSSIRFLNVQFNADVDSATTAWYFLADNGANIAGPGEMTVTEEVNSVTVTTGPLKFTVKGTPFNVIDEAFVDLSGAKQFDAAHRIIAPGNAGMLKVGAVTSGNATVSLFQRTESRAVIKVDGIMGAHKFLMYITAFRNKPYVQITHNWYFNDPSASALFALNDLSIRLMTEVTGARTITSSRTPRDTAFPVTDADNAILSLTSNDLYTVKINASTVASGKAMTAADVFEEKRLGWIMAANGDKGIGAAIRGMWQMAPKSIELKPTGEVVIGLYRPGAPALSYYGGNGRTHSVMVSFGNDAALAKEGFCTVTQPLYPVAPPVWYCGMTKALADNIVHNDKTLFSTVTQKQAQFNTYFNKYSLVYQLFGHSFKRAPLLVTSITDLYSFERFGNCTDAKQGCGGQHYSNNYYDFPHLGVLGFIVTGKVENLELAVPHATHLMDLNLDNVSGDCKGCPGVDIWDGYQSCSPTWWQNANHWKAQSFFELNWLTGDPIWKDFGLRACQKPMNSDFMGGEHRSTGHILEGLSGAWQATWNTGYRDRMRTYFLPIIDSRTTTPTSNYFQNAIVGEGLMYQIMADSEYTHAVDQLRNWGNFLCANQAEYIWGRDIIQSCWFLCGLSALIDIYPDSTKYKVLGDSIWSYFMTNVALAAIGTSQRQKFYNETYRGPIHYLKHLVTNPDYLSTYPDYANLSIAVEKGTKAALPRPISLSTSPNPFSRTVRISIEGASGPGTIRIYSPAGRLVHRAAVSNDRAALFTAADLAPGVYVVRFEAGKGFTAEKKLVMLK